MAYTTINKSSLHMNTKLYTGTGSTNAQTGVGFQPDLLWNKSRTTADNHLVYDAIRGITKTISPDLNSAEATRDSTFLTSIDSDGFTVGSNGNINANGQSFVMWNWKANGAGSANTDGTINSTVSVNQSAGFSIVTYTGTGANATIGHGLGSVPKMIITKALGAANSWGVYHASTGNNQYMYLDSTQAALSATAMWNDTTPTSSVFSVGTSGASNASGAMIAYCFAEKTGYSKFGKYNGTSSTDGAFIYLGFKPTFFMAKCIDNAESWYIFDNKREGYNVENRDLYADNNGIEGSADWLDFVSNGVKFRYNSIGLNGSSNNYIFMAFGQSLVGDNNVPCTAR
jgi:hypothetical protein